MRPGGRGLSPNPPSVGKEFYPTPFLHADMDNLLIASVMMVG